MGKPVVPNLGYVGNIKVYAKYFSVFKLLFNHFSLTNSRLTHNLTKFLLQLSFLIKTADEYCINIYLVKIKLKVLVKT